MWLLYNVVSLAAAQQSESAVRVHACFDLLPIQVTQSTVLEFPELHSRFSLVTCSVQGSVPSVSPTLPILDFYFGDNLFRS